MAKQTNLKLRVRESLAKPRATRQGGFQILRGRLPGVHARFPHIQREVRRIKLDALESVHTLVPLAVERLRQNGMQVYLAYDNADARRYILSVLKEPGLLIKSKSNNVKEVGILEELPARGIQVVETDLGDRINQLNGTYGGHVLAPAVDIPLERVRELYSDMAGRELPPVPEEIVSIARTDMRQYLERADYGLSGANAIAADTGTVLLTENEGNIRAVSSLPRIHVVVAGINKIVATFEDAVQVLKGAALFGVGQDIGTYISCISGPGPAEGFGPSEVHVVLVDNGRTRAVEEGFAEAFACINCGSCLNTCPVFSVLGDGYGLTNLGGIGVLQETLMQGLARGQDAGLSLCLNCTRCISDCPAEIDTPAMTNRLREKWVAEHGLPPLPRLVLDTVKSPGRLRAASFFTWAYQASGLQWLARSSGLTKLLGGLGEAEAMLPSVSSPGDWTRPGVWAAQGEERAQVQLFAGCVMSTLFGRVNRATIQGLTGCGCRVSVAPGQGCCGALHEHAGDFAAARELARANIAAFEQVEGPIVVNSAGCAFMLKSYPHLLHGEAGWAARAEAFARRVIDLSVFLGELDPPAPPRPLNITATYQDACHLACAQNIRMQPRNLLTALGVEIIEMKETDACCGAAGIYVLSHQDVSLALLQQKVKDALDTGAPTVVTANPGCLMHLQYGLRDRGVRVVHLAELLAEAYGR